jgi:hypothetical protein
VRSASTGAEISIGKAGQMAGFLLGWIGDTDAYAGQALSWRQPLK